MYATKIFGGQGTLSEPLRVARSRYTFGIHTEPNQLTQPWLIVHNGKLEDQEMMQSRYTGLIAKGTVPCIVVPNDWKYDAVEEFMRRVDVFLSEDHKDTKDESGKYFLNIHAYMNLLDSRRSDFPKGIESMDSTTPDVRYILTKVWPKLKPEGLMAFKDHTDQYIVCEQSWFERFVNDLQYLITTQLQLSLRGGFTIKPYGLGTIKVDKNGLDVQLVPSIYTEFFSKNKIKLFLISDDRTMNDKAYQFMWTFILARKMQLISKEFGLFKDFGKYSTEDWMAWASEQISYLSGYGDSSATLKYQATDLIGQLRDEIGNGIAETYEWQDFSPELIEELIEFWIIRRMAAANIKAYTTPITLELTDRSDKLRAAYDWTQEHKSQLPGLGGDASPYLFMPKNDLGSAFVLPMILRDDPVKANDYRRQPQRTLPMTVADVRHGEIQGNPLEPTTAKESYIRLNVWNDSRRWDITYPWYKLYVWKFPITGIRPADWKVNGDQFLSEKEAQTFQWMMFLLSSMSQGATTYSEGFFVYDSLGLFGEVPAPYVYGPANPIQQAISATPVVSEKEAAKIPTTPAPGAVSMARTEEATAPSPIAKSMATPPLAETTETPATPPPNQNAPNPGKAASEELKTKILGPAPKED